MFEFNGHSYENDEFIFCGRKYSVIFSAPTKEIGIYTQHNCADNKEIYRVSKIYGGQQDFGMRPN